jgi:hypothetical protein
VKTDAGTAGAVTEEHPPAETVRGDPEPPRSWWLRSSVVLTLWAAFVLGVHFWGEHLIRERGRDALRLSAAPFVGWEDVAVGWPALIPLVVGVGVLWVSVRVLPRLTWRQLLGAAALLTVVWSVALALGRSPIGDADPNDFTTAGLTRPLVLPGDEYLLDVPNVGDDPFAFLRDFTTDIDDYVVHVRSHPPGFLMLLWSLDRIGLGGTWPAAAVCLLGGAAAVLGVLVTAREVCGTEVARRAAPFVALLPGVIWIAITADALFAGVAAWSVTLAVMATRREGRRAAVLAVGSGVLWGLGLMLTYGLWLLVFPMAVLVLGRRRWALVPWIGLGGVLVMLAMLAAGFNWIDGALITRREYRESVARTRPLWYFFFSNVAALSIVVGPATVVALTRLRDRAMGVLLAGFGVAMLVANSSGLSKGEVERIWLPFAMWLPLACVALVPPGTRRPPPSWLAAQLVLALVVQLTIRTRW